MAGLPSGTVTFVFTDIEGSTELLKRLGERYGEVLSEHRRIVRETFGAANGTEIDTQGDAFFFAFPSARDAVGAAVEGQRAHAAHAWPDDAAVRVRMGLHTGEPVLGEEGYLGLDVVRAARICTVARGGTVLLSESTRALVGTTLPEGVAVFPRGERHLKGIDEPERVYELDIEGVAPAEAPVEEVTPEPQEPPEQPAPPSPASAPAGDQGIAEQIESFGQRLAADIQRQVYEKLERDLGEKAARKKTPAGGGGDDEAVDDIASRAETLAEQIQARVAAMFETKGIATDSRPDA
ncbi:MAG TPA: adenylate/guanylate cyclase domain-containing protein [Gaiellaceae bacterium]|nr:adenylate/guanylate cyclase domain-containing protein [Gaiellaceae bacterium]